MTFLFSLDDVLICNAVQTHTGGCQRFTQIYFDHLQCFNVYTVPKAQGITKISLTTVKTSNRTFCDPVYRN